MLSYFLEMESDDLSFLNCLYEKKNLYIDNDNIFVHLIYLSNLPPLKKNIENI